MKISQDFFCRMEVPFDDIDAGGVLYNAHYLKYCDRARNNIFKDSGWSWQRFVADECVLAEYRRAIQQGFVWVVTRFLSESDRVLHASHAFLPGELTQESVRQKVSNHHGSLESIRGVQFRGSFKLVPVAVGQMVPATMPAEFVAAIFNLK
jgi:YbgC/YbaW family acyl-CoA thioester hydrolase